MSNKTTVSYLSGAAPNAQYIALIVKVESVKPTGQPQINWLSFPGSEIIDTPNNEFLNGSIPATEATSVNSNGQLSYTIYIPVSNLTTDTNLDTFVIINVTLTDGSTSDYSDALQVYFPPVVPVILEAFENLDASGNVILYLKPDMNSLPVDVLNGNYTFNVPLQYKDASGNWDFYVSDGHELTSYSGDYYIQFPFSNTATEVYCAAQVSLSYYDASGEEFFSTSQLSDTLPAPLEQTPFPPLDLTSVFIYSSNTVINNWHEPLNTAIIPVDSYNIYYSINDPNPDSFLPAGSVPYPETSFTFDIPAGTAVGDVIYFYVTAVNTEGESGRSNITSVIIYESASAPNKFAITAIIDSSSTFVDCIFVKPTITTDVPLHYEFNLTEFGGSFPIFTTQITYVDGKEVYYESFSSIDYSELSTLSQDEIYTGTISLVTNSPDGIAIDGETATSVVTVSVKPTILQWDQSGNNVVFRISGPHILSHYLRFTNTLNNATRKVSINSLYYNDELVITFDTPNNVYIYEGTIDVTTLGWSGLTIKSVLAGNTADYTIVTH